MAIPRPKPNSNRTETEHSLYDIMYLQFRNALHYMTLWILQHLCCTSINTSIFKSTNAIANCASIMSYNELRFRFVIYEVLPARLHTCTRQLVPVFLSTQEMLGFFSYFLAPATSGRVTILLILIAPVMFYGRLAGGAGGLHLRSGVSS